MPNHVTNILTINAVALKVKIVLELIKDEEKGIGTIDFNKIIPMPGHIFTGNLGTEERRKYGENNWYDWSVSNWGTKWNAYNQSIDGNTLTFDTAWAAPIPVMKKLSKLFPDITFSYKWADEDIGQGVGAAELEDGKMMEVYMPLEGTAEARRFALEIKGGDPADYGMNENYEYEAE